MSFGRRGPVIAGQLTKKSPTRNRAGLPELNQKKKLLLGLARADGQNGSAVNLVQDFGHRQVEG